jgi:hypothetical protein
MFCFILHHFVIFNYDSVSKSDDFLRLCCTLGPVQFLCMPCFVTFKVILCGIIAPRTVLALGAL